MNHETESFVKLKYELITQDRNTWHLCETYPKEVRNKWAWRCAADVEHLADGHKEAEELIRVAKAYRDGLATEEELEDASYHAAYANADHAAYYAAYYAAYAATLAANAYAAYAAHHAANAAYYAAYAAKGMPFAAASYEKQFNIYIRWLVEELCEYEETKEIA